jgi:hypothetical protein
VLMFRDKSLGFRVQGSGFRVQSCRLRVKSLQFFLPVCFAAQKSQFWGRSEWFYFSCALPAPKIGSPEKNIMDPPVSITL